VQEGDLRTTASTQLTAVGRVTGAGGGSAFEVTFIPLILRKQQSFKILVPRAVLQNRATKTPPKGRTPCPQDRQHFSPRRFNVLYKRRVGIVDDRKTWHSFRHTFKPGLKMAGVPKHMRQRAGHSDSLWRRL
jgi:hypothetical protein